MRSEDIVTIRAALKQATSRLCEGCRWGMPLIDGDRHRVPTTLNLVPCGALVQRQALALLEQEELEQVKGT